MKKTLLIATCTTLLAAGANAAPPAMPKPIIAAGKVVAQDNIEHRRYAGLVSAPAVVQIMPRVSGELLKVGFKNGDFVRKGQMLYTFERIRYEAAVKSAEAKIAECKAHLEYARNSYNRAHNLYGQNAASKDSLENTLSSLEAYKSSLLAAEAALITAKDDLKNTVITAPMDGIIGITNFTEGNYITPSSGVLATINQVSPIRVQFAMSNRDFLQMFGTLDALKKEAKIALKLADDSNFEEIGTVEFIDNAANRRTDTIQIYANFPNKIQKLIPGSTVSVMLNREIAKNCPAITPSAVMYDNNSAYVYVLDKENKVSRRNVTLDNTIGKYVIVKEGLMVGETIIVDGTHKARPGVTVEIAK